MFAVFEDGSHQFRVEVGQTLTVDYREGANAGDALKFDRVLLAHDGENSSIGRPIIEGAAVGTEVLQHVKGEKLEIGKYRKRKNSRRHTGHRQKYTSVKVTSITVPDMEIRAPAADPQASENTTSEPDETA